MTTKICTICKKEKDIKDYYKDSYQLNGIRPDCKLCRYNYRKSHYIKNKARIKKQMYNYTTNRRKEDYIYKLQGNLGSRLRTAIKNKSKKGSAVKDLGMSVDNFKEYLERLWKPGMSWDNYGTAWHIDHIFPLSRADLTCKYQLRAVCHFTNLQPMWAIENIRKGNKL